MNEGIRYFAILEGFILIGWVLAVLQEARQFRPPPSYVIIVSLSYIGLVFFAIIELWDRVHESAALTWRTPLGVIVMTLGIGAMIRMWLYYRPSLRERRHAEKNEEIARRLRKEAGLE